eukprot:GHVR01040025.1.p1 GENE.GHVR01040025.1~~GHVR01040025.1.p1  ORF type:complete len:124 (+),score=1.23 GHVR01040025.1:702-1073(+)
MAARISSAHSLAPGCLRTAHQASPPSQAVEINLFIHSHAASSSGAALSNLRLASAARRFSSILLRARSLLQAVSNLWFIFIFLLRPARDGALRVSCFGFFCFFGALAECAKKLLYQPAITGRT